MKFRRLTLIAALSIASLGFSQNNPIAQTTAAVHEKNSETPEAGLIKVRFESQRPIPDSKAQILEERFKITFPDLRSISINAEEQTITLKLPRFNSQVTITRILSYFNTASYETL